jgi:hypothetical protein
VSVRVPASGEAPEGDVWNTTSRDVDEEIRPSGVLDAHREAVGRDPGTIRRSMQLYYRDDAGAVVEQARRSLTAGFTGLAVTLSSGDPPTAPDDVLPRSRELG